MPSFEAEWAIVRENAHRLYKLLEKFGYYQVAEERYTITPEEEKELQELQRKHRNLYDTISVHLHQVMNDYPSEWRAEVKAIHDRAKKKLEEVKPDSFDEIHNKAIVQGATDWLAGKDTDHTGWWLIMWGYGD